MVETVITIALSVVMLIAITNLFGTFHVLYTYEQAAKGSSDAASTFVHAVEDLVLPASRILSTHTFPQGTYGSTASALVLELPSLDVSGNILSGHYDYAGFYTSGGIVYRLIEADAASERHSGSTHLGENVVSLTFTYNNPDVFAATDVTVDIIASTTMRGEQAASHLTETLHVRNL